MEHYIHEESEGELCQKDLKSALAGASSRVEANSKDCFDCNICLDNAQDPVVTFCGHLYCWPCIYKWLQSHTPEDEQLCPVCKSNISTVMLVPLYGRGQSDSRKTQPFYDRNIPSRPKACDPSTSTTSERTYPSYERRPQAQSHSPRGPTIPNGLHPMVGMLGEMVYTSVFGNTESRFYWYPDSYQHVVSSSPRLRRQEMQAEISLNRISIFLFCCFVLCLLLF